MPHQPTDEPGLESDVPDEEGIDFADAEEQLAKEPEEKKNRTDGADGTDSPAEDDE